MDVAVAGQRWTEEVVDLVDDGDVDGAISLLESVISNLSTTATTSSSLPGADLRLATALGDLVGLHASRGNTLRADELRSRAIVLRCRAAFPEALGDHETTGKSSSQEGATGSNTSKISANFDEKNEDEEDDWEAIADRGAHDETLVHSLEQEARVSCSSLEKSSTPSSGPKRRGRGSFLYDKSVLYSDQCGSERDSDDKVSNPRSGSKGHVNEEEKKAGPSNEAQACVPSRYKVRSLKEEDDLLTKIDSRDLEPPMPRPKTSARTAQRLIAHGMGLRQFTNFGSDELKTQEDARRNRITAQQAMCDDAWGSD